MFGCYSFVNHVLAVQEGYDTGIDVPTMREAISEEFTDAIVNYAEGCDIESDDTSRFDHAAEIASDSDLTILVLGDQAGLFGRGTVGEGCDRDDLELPGVQRQLAERVLATGRPVVIVLLTGRPTFWGGRWIKRRQLCKLSSPGKKEHKLSRACFRGASTHQGSSRFHYHGRPVRNLTHTCTPASVATLTSPTCPHSPFVRSVSGCRTRRSPTVISPCRQRQPMRLLASVL